MKNRVAYKKMCAHRKKIDPLLLTLYLPSIGLECMALCVQIYLTMDRVDLAKDEVHRMQRTDEDCTLTQLSLARFNMYLGGDASGVARDIVCELMDKYRLVLENKVIFHQRR